MARKILWWGFETSYGHLHGIRESAEVANLCTKHQITQLRIRKKDDEKHNCKATNIFCTLQGRRREILSCFRYEHLNSVKRPRISAALFLHAGIGTIQSTSPHPGGKALSKKVNDNQKIFEKVENKEFATLKCGFIKQVCKGWSTSVKDLDTWRFER